MRANLKDNNHTGAFLFNVVYRAVFVRRVVLVLFISLLLQPIHRSYANELDETPVSESGSTKVEVESVSSDIPVPPVVEIAAEPPGDVPEEVVETEETASTEVTDTDLEGVLVPDSLTIDNETSTSAPASVEEEVELESEGDVGGQLEEDITQEVEIGTTTDPEVETEISENEDTSPSVMTDDGLEVVVQSAEEVAVSSVSPDEVATSTSVDDEPILPLVSETFSDGQVRFNKADCVQVDDGSYYCQPGVEGQSVRDSLVALPDAEGDLEIYLVKNDEYIQLTSNSVDDSAPYYDSVSKTVVWHQLVNSHYKIMMMDLETGETEAMTDGSYNDMEPARYGELMVWQRWVEDVWQIVLWQDGEEAVLTEGNSHHLSPSVYDDLVLWRTVTGNSTKILESYDVRTGRHTVIDDPEEAAMVNPRMVMVYDAIYDNGDRVTRGFDIATGKIISLGTLPAELPETIPETDATGEVRALIQAKPGEQEGIDIDEPEPTPIADPPVPVDPLTLVLTSATLTSTSSDLGSVVDAPIVESPNLPASESPDLTQFDLVIPPATSTQSME